MRYTRFSRCAALLAICAQLGCVGDDPVGADVPPINDGGDDGSIVLPPTPCSGLGVRADTSSIVRGEKGALQVQLIGNLRSDDVVVRVGGAPSGVRVTGETMVRAGSPSPVSIEVDATAAVATGVAALSLSAKCVATNQTVEASARLVIRGAPGTLDDSYGTAGVAEAPAGAQLMEGVAVGGGVLVSGLRNPTPNDIYTSEPILVRLGENGAIDTNFGTQGVAGLGLPVGSWVPYYRWAVTRGGLRAAADGASRIALRYQLDSRYDDAVTQFDISADGKTKTSLVAPTPIPRGMSYDSLLWGSDSGVYRLKTGGINQRQLPALELFRNDLSAEPMWQAPDFAALSADKPIYGWSWSVSPSVAAVMVGVNTVSGTAVQSVVPTLRTFNAATGEVIEDRLLSSSYPDEMWISRPSTSGNFVAVSDLNGYIPIAASGALGTYQFLTTNTVLTHAYAGFLGERTMLVYYASSSGKLHLVRPDGQLETPSGGISLQSFSLATDGDGKQQRLIDAYLDSENRALLLFGAASASVGWRVVRYWL